MLIGGCSQKITCKEARKAGLSRQRNLCAAEVSASPTGALELGWPFGVVSVEAKEPDIYIPALANRWCGLLPGSERYMRWVVPWGWGNVQWGTLLGAFLSWRSRQARGGSVGPGKQPWVEHDSVTVQLGPSPLEYSSVGRDGGCRQRKGAANREGQRRLKFHFYSLHSFSQVRLHETRP